MNALILRQLQAWQEIGTEQNSLIILVPTEFAKIVRSLQDSNKATMERLRVTR